MPSIPPRVSFEFFPAKTPESEAKLWAAVTELAALAPQFVSVTYGAGGTTRDRTHQTVKRIRDETGLEPAAHLTCVGASRAEIDQVAKAYWDAGVRHIVALRGDPPQGEGHRYRPHPEGYPYAADLIAGLRRIAAFEISVAAFPEKHPESASFDEDIEVLRGKMTAGAHRAITQYFFDIELFLRLRDRATRAGIALPLVPGIVTIGNFGQLRKFSAMCGASVPDWLAARMDGLDETPQARDRASVEIATELAAALLREGVEQLHFYTLNRADLTAAICRNLGIGAAKAHLPEDCAISS